MFDSSCPPLLVQPVKKEYVSIFPSHEGYNVHIFTEDQALVSYKDGWTLPLSVQQQKYISAAPLLMVRDSGRVTSNTSTTTKGYAHIFCRENGEAPVFAYKQAIFLDKPVEWMFIQDTVTMIWFQYGSKNQYLGGLGHNMEKIYYGKLLIRKFDIKEDIAPGFDKKADNILNSAKQFRVKSHQIYNRGWDVTDESPEKHLQKLLSDNGLEHYWNAVSDALKVSSGS